MTENKKQNRESISLSKLGDLLVVAAMRLLLKKGEMPFGDLVDGVEGDDRIFDQACEPYPSGMLKWRNSMLDRVRRFVRAGLILRDGGVWSLTEPARDLLSEHSSTQDDEKIIAWVNKKLLGRLQQTTLLVASSEQDATHSSAPDESESERDEASRVATEERALMEIKQFIQGMDEYDFQKLVAALLRAMGYFVAHVAPRGKDGGVDIVAYEDPLGKPSGARLKVAVKRYGQKKTGDDRRPDPKDVRELANFLRHDQDVGVFVCSTTFTPTSWAETKQDGKRIRLIDVDEFIRLWVEFYPNVGDDRKLLPLYTVRFLDREGVSGR